MTKTSENIVTLGLVQMVCQEDVQTNLDRAVEKVKKAAQDGAQIICLQELFSSRYFCQSNDATFFDLAKSLPDETTQILSQIAKDHKIVLIGSLFEKDGSRYFNSAVVLDADGTLLGKYRKVHIPDDPQNFYSEKYYFSPGDLGFNVFQTRYAKIGVQICWDQWFPEGARVLALQGAEILFYPTAIGWPVEGDPQLGKEEYQAWVTVQRGHAISNTVFLAAANRTGLEKNLNFWGGSFVSDPLGRVLGQSPHDLEDTLIVSCDLNKIKEVRRDWPFLSCRREENYSPLSGSKK